ncbi:hypothetical protein [Flavobacterium gelatinilyticum]|uniref:hypothetical protein n=1 Tax=Flavobacterium gelatinilyticum TaxID=3003260 RepID=UPI00248090AC|nr:hypothetical protein [Flavobacterium gelatinilyticum]
METKLKTITGHYHSYVADQVLTHFQLNETIDYFDDQNRLNRIFLTGTGIVCGFQMTSSPDFSTLTITQGTGITTDGDLIKLKSEAKNEIDGESDNKQKVFDIDFPSIHYKSYRKFENDKAKYLPFLFSDTEMVEMWELLPAKDGAPESGESELKSFPNLKDQVVLLYLENYAKDASLCDEIDCSNKGREQIFNLRVLVVSQTTANFIIGKTESDKRDTLYKKYDLFEKYNTLEELGIKKVIPTFNSTAAINQIKQLFNTVVSDISFRNDLIKNLSVILTYSGYDAQRVEITNKINSLTSFDYSNTPVDIHYIYDLLKDVVATYKELKDLFIQIKSECRPPVGSFPKHLLLGLVQETKRYKNYRHQFYKSPVYDQNKTAKHFDSLVRRLSAILNNFQTVSDGIKITPSKSTGKLGCKSVPYYYKVDDNFLHAWDFEKSSLYNHQNHFSYHTASLINNDYIRTPLKYCTDDYDFYRIEGYLHKDIDEVKTFLNTKRIEYGLDFDYYILDITEDAADLKILFNTNYAFEHKAGVKKGGTLLILKSGTTFITDFSIDGKINPESELGFFTLSACIYPWISSLKYINNLCRSLNGTPSKIKATPTHYVLSVRKYTINGVNLVTSPVTIRIPLKELIVRRLHVVMETLNKQFPTGLLFDFIEEQKKLKIMKLEKDKYEFEIQDITQSWASPVYKFTENGIIKNNRIYRAAGITCSLINAHNPKVYQKIHSTYEPVNKDDDYGAFDGDWSRWESYKSQLVNHEIMKDMRRFTYTLEDFEQIPGQDPKKTAGLELREIARSLIAADAKMGSIYVGGDWTNGNWVNSRMFDYYRSNLKKTNDTVVLFINLRKKLHNEDRVSKYMIHIPGPITNTAAVAAVMSQYATKAEFYYQLPSQGNFIKIY